MAMIKKHFIIISDVSLLALGGVARFEGKAPGDCRKIISMLPFTHYRANFPAANLDIKTALSINNKKIFLGNNVFALGYDDINIPRSQMVELDEVLNGGELIEGYIECIRTPPSQYRVALYFTYLTDQD